MLDPKLLKFNTYKSKYTPKQESFRRYTWLLRKKTNLIAITAVNDEKPSKQ